MTIQDFILEAGKEIRSYLEGCGEGDVQVSETDIVKANDTVLHGLILRRDGSAAGANLYLDDLFDADITVRQETAYDLISSGEIERIEKILVQERKEKSHGEDPCRAA